jgi:dTDP-4-dehydrorhamnose 3,5-epimerase
MSKVEILKPTIFPDRRGFFWEFDKCDNGFHQINISNSKKNVLRGMHYQEQFPQTKIITVASGRIFDAWVDVRKDSATYGSTGCAIIDGYNPQKIVIPRGFAHGFLVLSDNCSVIYQVDSPRIETDERIIRWDSCGIQWPLDGEPILSEKDLAAPLLTPANRVYARDV